VTPSPSPEILQRQRAEHELRESEARVRAILDCALSAVVVIDAEGKIIDWNARAPAIFGRTRAEALGQRLAETIIPPRYREAHDRGLKHFLATGEGPVFHRLIELSALRRDGTEFPIELSISPLKSGDAVTFCGFITDISQRKRAEAALIESQDRLRTLTESLPHLVWTCTPDGYCDYLSRQWVEYTGRPEAEQLGSGWAEQLHPDDRERVQDEWVQSTKRGDSFDVEFRIRRSDGVFRWFKTRALPLRDVEGHIVKWFGSNTDFEDYKRSEERLQAQLARLKLLDHTTRAIGERQDLRSIFQVVVRSLEDHLRIDFGCVCLYDSAQQALTVSCIGAKSHALAMEMAMPEQGRITVEQNGLEQCVHGQLVYESDARRSEFSLPQRLARVGLFSLVIAPLIVERSMFGVMIAARREPESFEAADCEFLRQLSEHVALAAHQAQLYSALQRAYDDLRQTQQTVLQQERLGALGQMASGVAHDINNALSPAAIYVHSLLEREDNLSERARKYLVIIQRAIQDVAYTVARMREFCRPHEPQLTFLPVNLNSILEHVIDLTRARWSAMPQERGIVIRAETDLTYNLPAIMGAESEIRDALTNLVLNAVDAMPAGGTLTLRSRVVTMPSASPATAVHIEVCDTGIGMDERDRSRCLEPFFTTKGERGTGLGLAMVYGMVQRHGAEVEIDSEPGKGTTVRIIFPVAAATPSPSAQPAASPDPAQRLRILVVDDDPMLLQSLRNVLEEDGHVIAVADGGQAGIDSFDAAQRSEEHFAAVITDLGMPYVDGRRVAGAIKKASPRTPVILLTGWGHRLLAENEIPDHVDRVLGKPPRLAELRMVLAELTQPGAT
jgi:PAS domain S-box-containing protein